MSYQTGLLSCGFGAQFFEQRFRGHCEKASHAQIQSDRSRVYFIEQIGGVRAIKIGFTAKNDAKIRLATLQGGNPQELRIMLEVPGSVQHEELVHCVLTPHWLRGEWFTLDRLSAGFIEVMRARGLAHAILEYAKDIHDKDHAKILRRLVKEACSGVQNIAFTNWGKTHGTSFENKQIEKTLAGAALGWTPRVIGS